MKTLQYVFIMSFRYTSVLFCILASSARTSGKCHMALSFSVEPMSDPDDWHLFDSMHLWAVGRFSFYTCTNSTTKASKCRFLQPFDLWDHLLPSTFCLYDHRLHRLIRSDLGIRLLILLQSCPSSWWCASFFAHHNCFLVCQYFRQGRWHRNWTHVLDGHQAMVSVDRFDHLWQNGPRCCCQCWNNGTAFSNTSDPWQDPTQDCRFFNDTEEWQDVGHAFSPLEMQHHSNMVEKMAHTSYWHTRTETRILSWTYKIECRL